MPSLNNRSKSTSTRVAEAGTPMAMAKCSLIPRLFCPALPPSFYARKKLGGRAGQKSLGMRLHLAMAMGVPASATLVDVDLLLLLSDGSGFASGNIQVSFQGDAPVIN